MYNITEEDTYVESQPSKEVHIVNYGEHYRTSIHNKNRDGIDVMS
jgi:hypothetical protein